MKRILLFCLLLIAGVNCDLIAQTTVVINTGTAGTPAHNAGPIYRSSAASAYDASRYSYLYTADELATVGILPGTNILSLGWTKNNTATTTGAGIFRIYLKNSSATTYSNATETWANLNAGTTLVYENTAQDIPATAAPNYITFAFTTPFLYTGGSLEISTEWDINQVTGNPSTGTFEWLWSTVTDRIYGTGQTALTGANTLSATTNSISPIDDRRPFLQITYQASAPCTSPPVPGTVASTLNPVCIGTNFTLSLAGGTFGTGQTYQWQSSPDGLSWTDITGATASVLNTTQLSSTYYRAQVTCGTSTVASAGLQVVSPAAVSGIYSINGGLPTGGTNFQSFGDAINFIKCGINGPVVFNVAAGSGPYNEQVVIPVIPNSSAANTVTFNGNGTTLAFASSDANARAALTFAGADFVTVKNMTIDATTGTYGWGVLFTGQAENDSIVGCTITTDATSTSTNFIGVIISGSPSTVASAGNNANNIVLLNNTINGGYYGIYNYGNSAAPFTNGNKFIGNVVNDFYFYGLFNYGSSNLVVSKNTFQRLIRSTVTTSTGIYLSTFTDGALVDGNKVQKMFDGATASTSGFNGIYISGDGINAPNIITNNLVSDINHEGTIYGIYNSGGANMKAYHNTISLDNTSATAGATYGFYQTTSDTAIEFRNNLVTISRGGSGVKYGIYMATSSTPLVSNNNNVYLNSAGTGLQYFGFNTSARTTLADWQAATSLDASSYTIDPLYATAGSDYKPTAGNLNDKGAPLGVSTDIDGAPRSTTNPDIGAYEFTIPGCTTPPTAGDATTSTASPCLNLPFTLQLSNNSVGIGQTYQWQSATSLAGPWTNVGTSSLNSDLTLNATGTLYYRAQVTCQTSSAFSTPVLITPGLPVAGVYTINGGVSTGGTNFQTFADAVNAMKCGVSGPVVFNVASGSGPYNEQVIIPAIPGASASNTITFNGNGATLAFASADGNSRSVIRLDGADYINIKDLLIDATGGTFGWGIHLTNQANNDSIVGCTITTDATATTTNFSGIVISGSVTSATTSGINANNLVVMNNTINGGYYGICNYGNAAAPYTTNNKIVNNTVNDFYFYGIYSYGSTGVEISNNTIQRLLRTAVTTTYGIYLGTFTDGALVEGNKVQKLFDAATTSTSTAYGIYALGDGIAAPNRIINNLISDINHEGSIYGLYNSGSANMKAFHNTISIDNTNATAGAVYGFYQVTSDTAIEFENNLISITRGGSGVKYGIYMSTSSTPLVSNYNNVYVNSTGSGSQYFGYYNNAINTIADWRTTTLLDANSVSVDPVYTALGSDYKPTSALLNDRGTPVGVANDIVGTPRSVSTPDIGAYEFNVAGCIAPPTPGDATVSVAAACPGQNVILQLVNNSVGAGQTYQWSTSTSASGPWTPVGNLLTVPDTTIVASSTIYYRANVTCGAATASSTPVLLNVGIAVSGTYTINNASPTGSGNFQSFTDAVNYIKCGVNGPVVFNVAPGSGPYTEQVVLPAISGTSAANTVIFNGNGATLAFQSADGNARSVLKFNGADFVTIRNLTIDATGGTFGWGIQLGNQSDNDSIVNCTVTTDGSATTTNFAGIVVTASNTSAVSGGNNANNLVIMNNTINGGYYGIVNYGNATDPFVANNKIMGNTINDFHFYGIYSYGTTNLVVSGNTIQRNTRTVTTSTTYGIFIAANHSGALVEKNKVQRLFDGNTASTSTAYGIYISADGLGAPNYIVNNLVSDISSEGTLYGIYNSGAANMKAYHNTISLDYTSGSTGAAYGFYQVTSDTAMEFKNNLITITRGGSGNKYGIYMATALTPLASDYNNVYVNSAGTGVQAFGYNGSARTTLLDWQTAVSKDINSLSIDPLYLAAGTDYTPNSTLLDNKGTPVGILTDILSAPRSTTTPDMGAYEFGNPLPVRLIDIAATRLQQNAVVSWTSTAEVNVARYEVERSFNGSTFERVGTVSPAANSAELKSYRFEDANVMLRSEKVFYRLKVVDRDGKFVFSNIVSVKVATKGRMVNVFPNPVVNDLFVKVTLTNNEPVTIRLTDVSGRILYIASQQMTAGSTVVRLPMMAQLAKGIYFLAVDMNGETVHSRIVR